MTGIIGSAKIITFRTTRNDNAYSMPLTALASGISTGHIALLLTFTDQELFNRYIINNNKIPHAIKIDPHTQQEYYEVYVSFWPENEAGLYSTHSTLRTYEFDAERSVNFSPFFYAQNLFADAQQPPTIAPELTEKKLAQLIAPLVLEAAELRRVRDLLQISQQKSPLSVAPIKKTVAARVPSLNGTGKSTITLGPVMILHKSRLRNTFGAQIAAAAETYTLHYTEWREAEVRAQNYLAQLGANHIYPKLCQQTANMLKARAQISETNLNHLMFPGQLLSHEEFMRKLEPFVTLGASERDSISIPIVRKFIPGATAGLALEPMLQYICEVAENPDVHQYHVLKLNCAAVTYNTLWAGAKNSPDPRLQKYLSLAWYVNLLGLTLTPTMLIQNAANAEQDISNGAVQPEEQKILRFSASANEESTPSNCGKMVAELYRSAQSFMQ